VSSGGGHGEKISRRREQAVAALLAEQTIAEAAARIGVSEATLTRWMRRPDLQAAFRTARRQVVEAAIAQLQSATSEAVQTLCRNLKAQSESVQIRAAVAILCERRLRSARF
jgi:transposase